jgi:hypothetical protein
MSATTTPTTNTITTTIHHHRQRQHNNNTTTTTTTGGDAPILSTIRLMAHRPILNHPHAEHKARRIREEQLYQVGGCEILLPRPLAPAVSWMYSQPVRVHACFDCTCAVALGGCLQSIRPTPLLSLPQQPPSLPLAPCGSHGWWVSSPLLQVFNRWTEREVWEQLRRLKTDYFVFSLGPCECAGWSGLVGWAAALQGGGCGGGGGTPGRSGRCL